MAGRAARGGPLTWRAKVYEMPDDCRDAGLALWRGLRGAAANRMTPHRAPAPTHQGRARSGRPSSAEQSHLVLESIVGDAVYQEKILAEK